MNSCHDAVELAEKVISIVHENGMYITNLQLQKVMYYIQGEYLHKFGCKAFDDPTECWPYGPAIKRIWNVYDTYGRKPINSRESNLSLSIQEEVCIKKVINEKLRINVWDLVDQTHAELPWRSANDKGAAYINEKDMETFFCQ